jgi:hypothetical protein
MPWRASVKPSTPTTFLLSGRRTGSVSPIDLPSLLSLDNTIGLAAAIASPNYTRLATPVSVHSGSLLSASPTNHNSGLQSVSTRPPAHLASLRRCWREGVSRPLPAPSTQVSSTSGRVSDGRTSRATHMTF